MTPADTPDADPTPDDGDAPEQLEGAEEERASIRAQRLAKLAKLREPRGSTPTRTASTASDWELRESFAHLEAGEETDTVVRVAGRLMLKREQGKPTFGQLRDRSGEVQLFVSAKVLDPETDAFAAFNDLDRGDWVGVEGTVMVTRKGELSVKVTSFELLSKALRPLPDKWKGLADVEARYRQRYVDLTVNTDARRVFEIRFAAVDAIRQELRDPGYLEVETPILNLSQGGATARPFITHYNALDIDTYLRIALELPLKRLLVGGFERVFEISRVVPQRGHRHPPQPRVHDARGLRGLRDYSEMIELTEVLVSGAAVAATGGTTVELRGEQIDLAPPWRRVTMVELIKEVVGVDIHPGMPVAEARAVLDGLGLAWQDGWGAGRCTHEVYDELVEPKVTQPTVVLTTPGKFNNNYVYGLFAFFLGIVLLYCNKFMDLYSTGWWVLTVKGSVLILLCGILIFTEFSKR